MLTLRDILKVGRMMSQTGGRPDVALDRQDNSDHRYVPPGAFREPITPYDEAHSVSLSLHYSDGEDGDVRIVQD
jgi:hypothetical protein